MIRTIIFIVLLSLLSACGQKGPLYLPEKEETHPHDQSE